MARWHNPSLRALHSDLSDRYDRLAMSYREADQDSSADVGHALDLCEALDEALSGIPLPTASEASCPPVGVV